MQEARKESGLKGEEGVCLEGQLGRALLVITEDTGNHVSYSSQLSV